MKYHTENILMTSITKTTGAANKTAPLAQYNEEIGMGLYIHVPFCIRKCLYCDFISYPYENAAAEIYSAALQREINLYAELFRSSSQTENRKKFFDALGNYAYDEFAAPVFTSVFLGGGTPTCLPASLLSVILKTLRHSLPLAPGAEFTAEANPGTVNGENLALLREFGVNRLSLGVQACQPQLLKTLGRIHTFQEALQAVKLARRQGFDNINLDLIFGIPGQTMQGWQTCLEQIIDLNPQHLSLYGLQLEEGTPLEKSVTLGHIEPCTEEAELAMYRYAGTFLKEAGFEQYEISNFARSNKYCRHNILYWQHGEYLGIGPGAHSYLNKIRCSNSGDLKTYAEKLAAGQLPLESSEVISRETEISETIFLALRMLNGLDLEAFARCFAVRVEDLYSRQIRKLTGLGLIETVNGFLRLTEEGLPLANIVFREFV
jgi:oxygen-independent coproporphyrinogen-3 oxidase